MRSQIEGMMNKILALFSTTSALSVLGIKSSWVRSREKYLGMVVRIFTSWIWKVIVMWNKGEVVAVLSVTANVCCSADRCESIVNCNELSISKGGDTMKPGDKSRCLTVLAVTSFFLPYTWIFLGRATCAFFFFYLFSFLSLFVWVCLLTTH